MALSRDLLRQVRTLDEFDLRRLMLFVGELLSARTGSPASPAPVARPVGSRGGPRISYRQQLVRCGKSGCTRCPHGPYWYAFWREAGKVRSRYLGRELPDEVKGLRPSDE